MTVTLPRYTLSWDCYYQWAPKDNDLGGIYTDSVHFDTVDDYHFAVSFRVGEGRQLGLLFAEVVMVYPNRIDTSKLHYCMGQFYNNQGAIKFSQFALNHFIETETWSVCPSFQAVDYTDGEPHTLAGDEIVSELYTW